MANEKLNPEKEESEQATAGKVVVTITKKPLVKNPGRPVKKNQPSNEPVTGSVPARKVPASNKAK